MKRTCFLLLVMITFFFGFLEVVPAEAKTGREVFRLNCRVCHPEGGNVMKPEKPMKSSEKLKNFKAFIALIRKPVAPMPAFTPEQMPEGEARTLYDYILNASRKNEWK